MSSSGWTTVVGTLSGAPDATLSSLPEQTTHTTLRRLSSPQDTFIFTDKTSGEISGGLRRVHRRRSERVSGASLSPVLDVVRLLPDGTFEPRTFEWCYHGPRVAKTGLLFTRARFRKHLFPLPSDTLYESFLPKKIFSLRRCLDGQVEGRYGTGSSDHL